MMKKNKSLVVILSMLIGLILIGYFSSFWVSLGVFLVLTSHHVEKHVEVKPAEISKPDCMADQPEIDPSMIGKFVTAKLKYHEGCRQGWIITCGYPYLIKGQSGNVYVCVGKPAVVTNPPKRQN